LAAIAGMRNVAILDYYLKHVSDSQLEQLDRRLAEEVLSLVFGRHKKGHFSNIGFEPLRDMGLPSLVHRRRLILRGRIESPFFIWQTQTAARTEGRAQPGLALAREAQVLGYHKKHGTSSPLYQKVRAKYPNW
jgi:hypothetical protein